MPLPKQLIQFKSSDKEWHDEEPYMKGYANMPSLSFRVICGPTNCGKSSLWKILIVHEKKPYTMATNNQSLNICYTGGGSNGTILTL